jgi:hypothetical protein
MTAANSDGKQGSGTDGKLPIDSVRDLVDHIRAHDSTKPHEEEIASHLDAIETELGHVEPHHPTLSSLLEGLRGLSAGATQALINSGAMNLLNEILGTGVPPVGR